MQDREKTTYKTNGLDGMVIQYETKSKKDKSVVVMTVKDINMNKASSFSTKGYQISGFSFGGKKIVRNSNSNIKRPAYKPVFFCILHFETVVLFQIIYAGFQTDFMIRTILIIGAGGFLGSVLRTIWGNWLRGKFSTFVSFRNVYYQYFRLFYYRRSLCSF